MPSSPLLHVLSFALVPSLALLVGGGAALFWTPSAAWRSAILHFAAGVVFSVVAVELLPDIVKQHAPLEVAVGFGLGVGAMLGVRVVTQKIEKSAPDSQSRRCHSVCCSASPLTSRSTVFCWASASRRAPKKARYSPSPSRAKFWCWAS